MTTLSNPNPNPNYPDDTNQESTQAAVNDGQPMVEPPKEASPASVFVNSQPIREDQVQNAISFLSHPRVKGSPVVHRRNFLERKGLTKEEIDEAFRRVPDPSPASASGQTSTQQGAQAMPSTNNQTQIPAQAVQPVTAAPSGIMSTMGRRFHWSHAVYAVGFLVISGAGTAIIFKNAIVPRFKSWIRRVVLDEENVLGEGVARKPSLAEETAAAAKAAAAAASDVAKATQEMLITKNEENKCFSEFMKLLEVQLQEIKTMKNAVTKLEGQSYIAGRNPVREEYLDGTLARSMPQMDGRSAFDTQSARFASQPTSNEPPHPKSYMEIMSAVQRGEKPSNVRDIDDRPPNPNQPIANPSLAPRHKPWEMGQPNSSSSYTPQPQVTTYGANYELGQSISSSGYAPQPQITTNGISYNAQDNGVTSQFNNDNSTPWWQQKNARITEVENVDGPAFGSVSNSMVSMEQPARRSWVPPQAPPVSMAEAAAAIRQPKSLVPKDVNVRTEEDTVTEIDELQRVTMISESGGQIDMNGRTASSEMNFSEIEEQVI